jgi:hypothetical protein
LFENLSKLLSAKILKLEKSQNSRSVHTGAKNTEFPGFQNRKDHQVDTVGPASEKALKLLLVTARISNG